MSSFQVPLLLRPLQWVYEKKGLAEVFTKELVGINAPKIGLGFYRGGRQEGMDNFVSEMGNTVGYFGGGIILDWMLSKSYGVFKQKPWFNLGKSLALFSVLSAFYWAMPFLRNYYTAKTTGSTEFKDVIKGDSRVSIPVSLHDKQKQLQAKLKEYKNDFFKIQGIGFGLGALAMVGTWVASHRVPWSKVMAGRQWIFNTFAKGMVERLPKDPKIDSWFQKQLRHQLKRSWFDELFVLGTGTRKGLFGKILNIKHQQSLLDKITDPQALFFWIVPAYMGWLQASRDNYEKREIALKFINCVICFFAVPALFKSIPAFKNVVKGTRPDFNKFMAGLVSSIVALGTMPQLLNMYLTRQRMKREQDAPAPRAQASSKTPSTAASPKPTVVGPILPAPAMPALTPLQTTAGVPSPFRLPSPVWPSETALQQSTLQPAALPPLGWMMPPAVLTPSFPTAA